MKKPLVFCLIALLCFGLVGCGTQKEEIIEPEKSNVSVTLDGEPITFDYAPWSGLDFAWAPETIYLFSESTTVSIDLSKSHVLALEFTHPQFVGEIHLPEIYLRKINSTGQSRDAKAAITEMNARENGLTLNLDFTKLADALDADPENGGAQDEEADDWIYVFPLTLYWLQHSQAHIYISFYA